MIFKDIHCCHLQRVFKLWPAIKTPLNQQTFHSRLGTTVVAGGRGQIQQHRAEPCEACRKEGKGRLRPQEMPEGRDLQETCSTGRK